MSKLQTLTVVCGGGLDEETQDIILGTNATGSARILQNYESADDGGYRRVLGHSKYSSSTVTGTGEILGVAVALDGVFAARKDSTDNGVYYSTGGAWSADICSTPRTGSVTRFRFLPYNLSSTPVLGIVDGVNPAAKYDGTTYTLLNGSGAPSNPKYIDTHKFRLALAGYSSNPSALTLSAPLDDTDYTAGGGAIEIVVGDVIVGLKEFRDTLYIFCRNSIKRLIGNTSADFLVEDVASSIGCVSGDTIQEVGGDLIFLAPDGLRSIAATAKIGDVNIGLLSSRIKTTIRSLIGSTAPEYFSSIVIRKKAQYRLFIKSDDADADAQGILGKLKYGEQGTGYEWSTLKGINAACCASYYQGDDELAIFGNPSTGYVQQLENGEDFDGAEVEAVYKTPYLTFGDSTIRKVLHKMRLSTKITSVIDIDLGTDLDFGEYSVIQPPEIGLMLSSSLSSYGSAVYGTSSYSGSTPLPVFNINLIGSGNVASFTFSSRDSNATHKIDSLQIQYAIKSRR